MPDSPAASNNAKFMDEGMIRYLRKIDWLLRFTHSDTLLMEPLKRSTLFLVIRQLPGPLTGPT